MCTNSVRNLDNRALMISLQEKTSTGYNVRFQNLDILAP